MTDTKPTPTPAPSAAAKKAAASAEASAKREGFASAAVKAAATKAATSKKPRARPARKVDAAQSIAKLKEGAADTIQAMIDKGEQFSVALGNERGPIATIEPELVTLEVNPVRRGGNWQVAREVVHNTHTLPRLTQFTHIWLMVGKRPIDVNELGSQIGLNPGQQLAFKHGKLVFG